MPLVKNRGIFSGIPVSEAMRRHVAALASSADIGQGIRTMIRNKVNAVLLTREEAPLGVVSKTDLMGAMYAQLPVETPLEEIMGSYPITCFPDDSVEEALEIMEAAGVHRLYVTGANREEVIGTVSYSEIVGLLYRYCRACERGNAKKRSEISRLDSSAQLLVRDVMTRELWTCMDKDPLSGVIETLSSHHMGAVLVSNEAALPRGVISKTDLMVAYHHGVSIQARAEKIMTAPVHSVMETQPLAAAIQQMLVMDVQRLFVHGNNGDANRITGVVALSDAARFRSGSCRACTAGRMLA